MAFQVKKATFKVVKAVQLSQKFCLDVVLGYAVFVIVLDKLGCFTNVRFRFCKALERDYVCWKTRHEVVRCTF